MYIAVDVGGTKTLVTLVDETGTVIRPKINPTNPDYKKFIDETVELINDVKEDMDIPVVSIAVPAHVETDDGRAKEFGNLDWHDVDIKNDFADKLGMPVIMDNDANMGALGESHLGAGQGYEVCLYVTVSTGIGTGVTVNGKIDPALRESEGGHMQFEIDGRMQIWESFASGKAFFEKYGKYGKDVDDPEIWKEWTHGLALGFEQLIAIIQPNVVVIGGSMGVHLQKYKGFLITELKEVTKKHPIIDMPPIVGAQDPELAVIKGCFVAARDYAETN